ncbi:MAG: hypothetical protein SNJ72_10850, partial [Fimbriimonadales bacterium]
TEKTRAYEQARAQQLVGRVSPIALERAPLPDRPIAPRPVLYTTVLATLGLMVGTLMAIVRATRSRRLTDRWEVERLLGVPVLLEVQSSDSERALPMAFWAMRSAGGGELWHTAVVVPIDQDPESQRVAQRLTQIASGVWEQSVEKTNLPDVVQQNGALRLQMAQPESNSKELVSAERMVLVCHRGYELQDALLNSLQLARNHIVGVILVGQEAKR